MTLIGNPTSVVLTALPSHPALPGFLGALRIVPMFRPDYVCVPRCEALYEMSVYR